MEERECIRGAVPIHNTSIPNALIGYSDSASETNRLIDLSTPRKRYFLSRLVAHNKPDKESTAKSTAKNERLLQQGVSFFECKDLLPIAKLEQIAFADSEDYRAGIAEIQNKTEAMKLSAATYGFSEFSLVAHDSLGTLNGYLLAYQGKLGSELAVSNKEFSEKMPVIYIDDLVSVAPLGKSAARLLKSFLRLYQEEGRDEKGEPLPILVELREETTAPHLSLFLKMLDKEFRDSDIRFEAVKLDSQRGGDTILLRAVFPKRET